MARIPGGKVIFIPFALPGERVRVKILEEKKKWSRGKLLEINSPSPHRREPSCPIFHSCGGCSLQHLEYSSQLAWKNEQVSTNLVKLGSLKNPKVFPTIGSPKTTGYRNKITFHWEQNRETPLIGFYQPGTASIVEPQECLLAVPAINTALAELREVFKKLQLQPDNKKAHRITYRYSLKQDEIMLVMEFPPGLESDIKKAASALKSRLPAVTSIWRQQNNRFQLLEGKERLEETLLGLDFVLGPGTFFQVNPLQAEKLFNTALQLLEEKAPLQYTADLHCGTGVMALLAAKKAQKVDGVDLFQPAIDDAVLNTRANQIENATFRAGSAEKNLPLLLKERVPDAVVLNPPRQGCSQELLKLLAHAHIPMVVYISCNPATLSRDIKILADEGYSPGAFQPIDMFPQTPHVECVASIYFQT